MSDNTKRGHRWISKSEPEANVNPGVIDFGPWYRSRPDPSQEDGPSHSPSREHLTPYPQPPPYSSVLQYLSDDTSSSRNNAPPYPDDNTSLTPIPETGRQSLIPSPAQKDLRSEAEKDLDLAPKVTGVAHEQTVSEKMVTLGEDNANSGILEDMCRLLEGVLNDEQRAKRLLAAMREGNDTQLWLDTLQVLTKLPGILTGLRSSILKIMLRLSKKLDLFPKCLTIMHVEPLGNRPVKYGGFGILWKGKIGEQVFGLKVMKVELWTTDSDVQKLLKEYLREAILWEQLEHPNVLPFMGMYYWDETQTELCLVSPWMDQGNLSEYLKSASEKKIDIDHYLLVHDVVSGLTYLHEKKIVHGDLKGLNVLITPEGRACLADFGGSRVVDSQAINFSSVTNNNSTGTPGWCAPELLNPPYDEQGNPLPCAPTVFSDMYAFAGVCYEIFAGKEPFRGLNVAVITHIVANQDRRPSRPTPTFPNDGMWKIMEDCWEREPTKRPAASVVAKLVADLKSFKKEFRPAPDWDLLNLSRIGKDVKHPVLDTEALNRLQWTLFEIEVPRRPPQFSEETVMPEEDSVNSDILEDLRRLLADVLEDEQRAKKLAESILERKEEGDTQMYIDILQMLAKLPGTPNWLQSSILETMFCLSKQSGLFPQSLIIKDVERLGNYPVHFGGYTDVWKGKIGERIVALKFPRLAKTFDTENILKDFMREGIIWQQLDHSNVLPFMGMHYLNKNRAQFCLVSPWMENGNLPEFLETAPEKGVDVDHYSLVHDIASGLSYLHYKKVVHGDLKGAHVLIGFDGRAHIADFGLSRVLDSYAVHAGSPTTDSSTGAIRWCSPELYEPPYTTTTFSDVYAFAGVCYEIFSGNVPFYGLNDPAVIVAIMINKEHPPRPEGTLLNDGMWKIMEDCWNFDPRLRPTASDIVTRVAGLNSFKTEFRPALQWDISDLREDIEPVLDEALLSFQRDLELLAVPNSPRVVVHLSDGEEDEDDLRFSGSRLH
ncbi:kinase-like protein [Marasmius fiardii PR-910]|nr:kinase-like protein [Marasmius fiardii PR-910]